MDCLFDGESRAPTVVEEVKEVEEEEKQ